MDHVNIFLAANPVKRYHSVRPRVECADGFTVSIQASDGHYCSPRETGAGYYKTVEVGYPSEPEPSLIDYAGGDSDVYGFVDVDVVNAIIDKHGGLK